MTIYQSVFKNKFGIAEIQQFRVPSPVMDFFRSKVMNACENIFENNIAKNSNLKISDVQLILNKIIIEDLIQDIDYFCTQKNGNKYLRNVDIMIFYDDWIRLLNSYAIRYSRSATSRLIFSRYHRLFNEKNGIIQRLDERIKKELECIEKIKNI